MFSFNVIISYQIKMDFFNFYKKKRSMKIDNILENYINQIKE